MPAGVLAVPFSVGGRAHSRESELTERVNRDQNPTRGCMAGLERQVTDRRIDDTMLIREAQQGNRAAFEELVRHYDQAVLRLALHLTGTEHDAQDVYQDAFLKAYKNIGSFRFECSFYTWIYRIVTNLCLDHLRKRTVRKEDAPVVKDARVNEAWALTAARGLRGFGDGFAIIVLPAYMTALGYDAARVGLVATASLLGTAVLGLPATAGAVRAIRRRRATAA